MMWDNVSVSAYYLIQVLKTSLISSGCTRWGIWPAAVRFSLIIMYLWWLKTKQTEGIIQHNLFRNIWTASCNCMTVLMNDWISCHGVSPRDSKKKKNETQTTVQWKFTFSLNHNKPTNVASNCFSSCMTLTVDASLDGQKQTERWGNEERRKCVSGNNKVECCGDRHGPSVTQMNYVTNPVCVRQLHSSTHHPALLFSVLFHNSPALLMYLYSFAILGVVVIVSIWQHVFSS